MNLSFQVAGSLRSATLTATVPMEDAVSRVTFLFQVNLVWTATGKPQPFLHSIRALTHSKQVEAIATGTVVTGGVNFTPEASDTATIQKESDGSLLIEKTP